MGTRKGLELKIKYWGAKEQDFREGGSIQRKIPYEMHLMFKKTTIRNLKLDVTKRKN